jgi:predicted flap endonuclease-1-like 5' DNA nuclease
MSKALTTARKLKELGILTLDQIADATGLSVGEVERL